MTKKDFELLAGAVCVVDNRYKMRGIDGVGRTIANELAHRFNPLPNFNPVKFYEACGIEVVI